MITPELKDNILNNLNVGKISFGINIKEAKLKFGVEEDVLDMLLNQFEAHKLLKQYKSDGGAVFITLKAEYFDHLNHGGYTAQEELLQSNFRKLFWELEALEKQLRPDNIETANKIASIAGNIATALTLFIK